MIEYIELTGGAITRVDPGMVEELNSYLWYAAGSDKRPARRLREPQRRMIFMYHQVLRVNPWDLRISNQVVDHINRDPLDNRRENLRIVSAQINMRNTTKHLHRVGICYDTTHDRWKAYVDMPEQPRINVGTYRTEMEAQEALAFALKEMKVEDHPNSQYEPVKPFSMGKRSGL